MAQSAQRVATFGTTIFTEMNQLAQQYQAINLGQGKPDFDTPPEILEQLTYFLHTGQHNQYAPGPGTVALRQAVADHAARFYRLAVDPVDGVIVTAGGTEAIFAAVLGAIDAGDQVIVIEPVYDSYVPNLVMAGARPIFVPLHAPDWTIDPDELRAAFSRRPRALILNSPHNPAGRVFTREELELIAQLCIEYDVTVISDEVYEHLYFAPAVHIPIATLPGMFERTLTLSSAGKMFSATGWKVGWVYGPPALIEGVARAHQFITFAVHHPTQEAVAYALNMPASYYQTFQAMYAARRQVMMEALDGTGLRYRVPEGTYFILADYTGVFQGTSSEFARYLTREIGVVAIPTEPFYTPEHASMGQGYVRFAFCKSATLLEEARRRLKKLVQK